MQEQINTADAHKKSLILEAEGLKQQLEMLSKVLGDTKSASRFMLEMKRIDQFKAIASGID